MPILTPFLQPFFEAFLVRKKKDVKKDGVLVRPLCPDCLFSRVFCRPFLPTYCCMNTSSSPLFNCWNSEFILKETCWENCRHQGPKQQLKRAHISLLSVPVPFFVFIQLFPHSFPQQSVDREPRKFLAFSEAFIGFLSLTLCHCLFAFAPTLLRS